MTQHTPEPWTYDGRADVHAATHQVAAVGGDGHNALENARRIVACVNALQGIPTEALENGAVAELLKACRAAHDSMLMAGLGGKRGYHMLSAVLDKFEQTSSK